MQLSIIVVSYNTADLTVQSIQSVINQLSAQSNWSPAETEIFLVDNASQDDSVTQVKALLKKSGLTHQVITNTKNVGFARANNQALKLARGKWLWLLNSDVRLKPNCLNQLCRATQQVRPSVGLLSPRLLNADLSAQNTGGDLPSILTLLCQFWFLDDIPLIGRFLPSVQKNHLSASQPAVDRGWLPGTALMIRSELYRQLGGLDEQIFMYTEDIEYCWRARQQGFTAVVIPSAQLIHLQSASSDKTSAYTGELMGLLYLVNQKLPSWQKPVAKFILKSGAILRALLFGTIMGDGDKGRAYRATADQIR